MQKNDIQLALFQCFTRILANLQPNLKTLCLWHILQPQFYTGYSSLILAPFQPILDHIYIWLDTLLILSNRVHHNWSYAFVQWCAYSALIIVSPVVNGICLPCLLLHCSLMVGDWARVAPSIVVCFVPY
jgi:hypothetical protein